MDVIKTSLIVAIGITLYYLLLQWPVSPASVDNELTNTNELISINESERSLSVPLSPLSSRTENASKEQTLKRSYFKIQNNDLSISIDAETGRFEVSELKNITQEKGSQEPFIVFGKTRDSNSGMELSLIHI